MSGAADDRWHMQRTTRPQRGPGPGVGLRDKPPGSSPTSLPASSPGPAGGHWMVADRPGRPSPTSGPVEDRPRDMARFDAQEAKDMLQQALQAPLFLPPHQLRRDPDGAWRPQLTGPQAFQGATRQGNPDRATLYKAANGAAMGNKSASPWGAKANQMANGQDFFVQLRKGVAALQHPQPGQEG